MIESILTALAFGTVWFWVAFAVTISLMVFTVASRSHFISFLGVVFLTFLCRDFFTSVVFSWWLVVGAVVVYSFVGIVWSLYKWSAYVTEKVKNGVQCRKSREDVLRDLNHYSQKQQLIIGWIAYWPWSLTWELTGEFFAAIYRSLVESFDKITARGVQDLPTEAELKEKK